MKTLEDYRIEIIDAVCSCEDDMDRVKWCQKFMQEFADREKAALKEKIYNHVVSKLAEYERDDDGDPWYNGAKTEMEEFRKWLNAETLK